MSNTTADSAAATHTGPLGSGERTVHQGECVESIAAQTGHLWQTIWNAPENAVLSQKRKNPNTLLPGDRLHVPALRSKEETCASEKKHRFRRKGMPSKLRLVLRDEFDVPRAGLAWELVVDRVRKSGKTGVDGAISVTIPPRAESADLAITPPAKTGEPPPAPEHLRLLLRNLDPLTEPSGIEARLVSLGYLHPGLAVHGVQSVLSPMAQDALAAFQSKKGLTAKGSPDAATLTELKKAFGQ